MCHKVVQLFWKQEFGMVMREDWEGMPEVSRNKFIFGGEGGEMEMKSHYGKQRARSVPHSADM